MQYLVLLIASFLAAAISGSAGFGGALLLLPLLVSTVGVTQAVPLLTVAQLIGNISRAAFGFHEIRWKPVAFFLAAAIPLSALGAFSFVRLPRELVVRCIGVTILLFVVLKYMGVLTLKPSKGLLIAGGGAVGFLSGLVGSAGPLGAAVFLVLALPPVSYIASEATTALVMHGVKMLVYRQFIFLDRTFWLLAVSIGGAMVLGTWSAKRVIELIPRDKFQQYVSILLAAIALYMAIHG